MTFDAAKFDHAANRFRAAAAEERIFWNDWFRGAVPMGCGDKGPSDYGELRQLYTEHADFFGYRADAIRLGIATGFPTDIHAQTGFTLGFVLRVFADAATGELGGLD